MQRLERTVKWVTVGKVTKRQNPWHTAKNVALYEQGRATCEVPGCYRRATDAHHGIVKRDKNCVKVDSLINVVMVCHECHMSGKADGHKNMVRAVKDAVRRYGREEVEKWLMELADEGKQVQEQYNAVVLEE